MSGIKKNYFMLIVILSLVPVLIISSAGYYSLSVIKYNGQEISSKSSDYVLMETNQFVERIDGILSSAENLTAMIAERLLLLYTGVIVLNTSDWKDVSILLPWTNGSYNDTGFIQSHMAEIEMAKKFGFLLEKQNLQKNEILLLYFSTTSGIFVSSNERATHNISQTIGYDARHRVWFRGAMNSSEIYWSPPYIDANTHQEIITCSLRIEVNNTVIGVLAIDINLHDIVYHILDGGIGATACSIVDIYNNDVITSKGEFDFSEISKEINGSNMPVLMRKGDYWISCDILPTTGWRVYLAYRDSDILSISEKSLEDHISTINSMKRFYISISVITAILMVMLSFALASRLAYPIIKLSKLSDRIASGDLSLYLSQTRDDEIGILEDSIARLAAQVRAAMYFLEKEEKMK